LTCRAIYIKSLLEILKLPCGDLLGNSLLTNFCTDFLLDFSFIKEMELFMKFSFSGYWKSFLEFYDFLIKNSLMLFRIFAGFSWDWNWGFLLFSNFSFYQRHFHIFTKFGSFLGSGCATSLMNISISLQTPALRTLQKFEMKNYDDVLKCRPFKYLQGFYQCYKRYKVTADEMTMRKNWIAKSTSNNRRFQI
jgi:hypothetical protein